MLIVFIIVGMNLQFELMHLVLRIPDIKCCGHFLFTLLHNAYPFKNCFPSQMQCTSQRILVFLSTSTMRTCPGNSILRSFERISGANRKYWERGDTRFFIITANNVIKMKNIFTTFFKRRLLISLIEFTDRLLKLIKYFVYTKRNELNNRWIRCRILESLRRYWKINILYKAYSSCPIDICMNFNIEPISCINGIVM